MSDKRHNLQAVLITCGDGRFRKMAEELVMPALGFNDAVYQEATFDLNVYPGGAAYGDREQIVRDTRVFVNAHSLHTIVACWHNDCAGVPDESKRRQSTARLVELMQLAFRDTTIKTIIVVRLDFDFQYEVIDTVHINIEREARA
ncbi:MAG: hypothetical protein RI947_1124 [Candidatus Parcubacteria bacterium]|jgi:hypothetical protein